ncbi:hypothetical protein C8F04DRAFT_1270657 [Mycena alexandri]|uniref:Uncharacterized protein n=1 Tax=Mycena alexandri TaxID=1745969 RepID=A0AAD6SDF2_9AGAR|nr:hypothetical protein C8F04DRAFT_1270657 [Mycena alexandri]
MPPRMLQCGAARLLPARRRVSREMVTARRESEARSGSSSSFLRGHLNDARPRYASTSMWIINRRLQPARQWGSWHDATCPSLLGRFSIITLYRSLVPLATLLTFLPAFPAFSLPASRPATTGTRLDVLLPPTPRSRWNTSKLTENVRSLDSISPSLHVFSTSAHTVDLPAGVRGGLERHERRVPPRGMGGGADVRDLRSVYVDDCAGVRLRGGAIPRVVSVFAHRVGGVLVGGQTDMNDGVRDRSGDRLHHRKDSFHAEMCVHRKSRDVGYDSWRSSVVVRCGGVGEGGVCRGGGGSMLVERASSDG